MGHECRFDRQKLWLRAYIWLHCMLLILRMARCYQRAYRGATGPLIASSTGKQRNLLMARDDDEMFMTRSLNVTPKTREQQLIVRSDKSVAYVTNNKRLRSTFCTIEANYWQTRRIARPLCDSRATYFNILLPTDQHHISGPTHL